MVGPPLTSWSRRTFIAGQIPNTPDNLVRWLRNPRAIEPGTAMPGLGLDDRQARDVAAYLYTLR
jgi:cytochrome c1